MHSRVQARSKIASHCLADISRLQHARPIVLTAFHVKRSPGILVCLPESWIEVTQAVLTASGIDTTTHS